MRKVILGATYTYFVAALATMLLSYRPYACDDAPIVARDECLSFVLKQSAAESIVWPVYWITQLVGGA